MLQEEKEGERGKEGCVEGSEGFMNYLHGSNHSNMRCLFSQKFQSL